MRDFKMKGSRDRVQAKDRMKRGGKIIISWAKKVNKWQLRTKTP